MAGSEHRSRRRWLTKIISGAVLSSVLVVASGCGLGTAGGFVPSGELSGELANIEELDGTISVGSKNFTEQLLLGKIAAILIKSAGADMQDLTNIPGSAAARQAQVAGQVDLEWEYTGTAWLSYMGEGKPIRDSQGQYEAVRDRDLEQNGLVWLPPAPMNNTYSFAVTAESAEKYGLSKLSNIGDVPKQDRTFCVESEFLTRNDGFRPMLKAYGLQYGSDVPEQNVKVFDTGAIYQATADGECVFGEVFTTDGRIKALNLTVMEDDNKFFPNYNVAVVVREETMEENPQLADLFAPVSAKLTNETLLELNAQIDVEGRSTTDVADEWLRSEGFIS